MILRFCNADKDVSEALASAVRGAMRPQLVVRLQGPRDLAFETRVPFKQIVESAGGAVDLVAVIDDGSREGMWRDPFGDLCEQLYGDPRQAAAAAATGLLLVSQGGRPVAAFRRSRQDPLEDAERVTDAIARLAPGLRPFRRAASDGRRPDASDTAGAPAAPAAPRFADDTPGRRQPARVDDRTASAPAEPPPLEVAELEPVDPYEVLGLGPSATLEEARRAWHDLLQQYHPDKVASLAWEFRELAERRTRELNEAFESLEKQLGSSSGRGDG